MGQSESYGVFEYTHQWPEFYKRKKRIKVLKNSNKEEPSNLHCLIMVGWLIYPRHG